MRRIVYAPEVLDDLVELIETLVNEGYLYTYDDAEQYVLDILQHFRKNIEIYPCKTAPAYFEKYGLGLKYMPYKRNQRTIWYIVFAEHPELFHVVHITNNHIAAHYF